MRRPGSLSALLRGLAAGALLLGALVAAAGSAPHEPAPMEERVRTCTGCHGEQGRAGPEGYYPRLAGKPAGYLAAQLINFAEGRRHHGAMQRLLATLDDATLQALAQYFADLTLPYPPPPAPRVSADQLARGRLLALSGDPSRKLPACASCHGQRLTGVAPAVPGLLGLPTDYLNAQLGAWRSSLRKTRAPDCMAEIARRLGSDDLSAVTHWLASERVPDHGHPQTAAGTGADQPATSDPDLVCAHDAAPGAGAPAPDQAQRAAHAPAASPSAQPDRTALSDASSPPSERGEMLARAGNCIACHTVRGRPLMTGARPIDTPFGVVFSSNLTPDPRTGIGAWTANDFWTALHRGRSRDGRRLAPAFPYEHTTLIRRDDSDAIFAWLKTLAPVDSPQPAHQLTWPLGTQPVLALWQAFFFKPASFVPDPARDDRWNRGAYLVEAVGHCAACHGPRNMFGATRSVKNLSGSALPGSAWVAPSLLDDRETGLASTQLDQIVQLLKTGRSVQAGTSGPMADVVQHGLQYLGDDDLLAIAVYLKDRAYASSAPATPPAQPPAPLGARIYQRECADCHGESGAGQPPHYPALRGNRAVLHQNPANTVLAVLHGGYSPVTRGNPAPAGMPPFALPLSTAEVAAVVSWIRGGLQAPGPGASPVSPSGVEQIRNRSR